jgi:hypothetical protein
MLLRSPIHLVNEVPRSRVSGENSNQVNRPCQQNLSSSNGVPNLRSESVDGSNVGRERLIESSPLAWQTLQYLGSQTPKQ